MRLLLIAVFALASCGGDEGTNTPLAVDAGIDATTSTISAESYCEKTADFFCDFYLRCGRMNVETKAECLDAFAESCEGRYEKRYADLDRAGLLELSDTGVAACEAHLDVVECGLQIRDLAGPCQAMWAGQQSAGETCSFDVEALVCEIGTECVLDLSLCGECETLAAPSEACGDAITCGTEATCTDGVCLARKQVGEVCGDEDRCVVSASCIEGVCVGPQFVAVGQACDQANRCPYLSQCSGGTCVATNLIGGICDEDWQCATGYCSATSTCTGLLDSGIGCQRSAQCASGKCDGICVGLPSACF
jgi:hypothetical protein